MPYADIDDVEVYYGAVGPELEDKVDVLLEQAEAMIRQEVPDLDDRVTDGRSQRVLVVKAEAAMVVRVLRNPGGYINEAQTVGDVTYSYTLSMPAASGLLELTDGDRDDLGVPRRTKGRGQGRAFTLPPQPGVGPRLVRSWPCR